MPPGHPRDMLEEFAGRLNASGVPYMLVGASAGHVYGIQRTSIDFDFVVDLGRRDVRLFAAQFARGFYCDELMILDAIDHLSSFNIISHQTGGKADFMILNREPFRRAAFARRLFGEVLGVPVWITTGQDLVVSKLLWARMGGSERQLADVRAILASGRVDIDDYLMDWVRKLGLEAGLAASRETRYDA